MKLQRPIHILSKPVALMKDGWFRSIAFRNGVVLALFLATAMSGRANIGIPGVLEPQAFRLRIPESYVGVRVDAQHEETQFVSSGEKATYDRWFVGPVFGLKAYGSIYHPRLLTFTLNGEISPGYASEESSNSVTFSRNETLFLGNYNANFILLSNKPYRTNLYINQSYTYRDYDFFNRVEVDSLRYGASFGYQSGPVPFTITMWQRQEDTIGQTDNSSLTETGLTLDARNTREKGETTFNYTYTDYQREDFNTEFNSEGGGTEQSIGISDSETFGKNDEIHLTTSAGYASRGYSDSPTDDFNTAGNMSWEHSPTLTSFYDLSYDHESAESSIGNVETDNLNGGVSLRHQLFQSLTSTLRIQGMDYKSAADYEDVNGLNLSSETGTRRFGGGLTEQYSKKLGTMGRLSITASALLEHTTQENGGSTIVQTDEAHVFSSNSNGDGADVFFLSLPFVDQSTIFITDDKNTEPEFREGLDYTVSTNGQLTMIRRISSGRIPQNATVYVDYRAAASPSGDYDTLTAFLYSRMDLWNDLLSVYSRISTVTNNAPADLLVQDMDIMAVGIESRWRWLRVGCEYEVSESTFSSYQTARMFESLSFRPDDSSTLSIDFLQSQTNYEDSGRSEQNYNLISRYRRSLTRNLGVNLDAGLAIRRGEDVDQTLATARSELEYRVGRVYIRTGYSYEYGKFLESDERQKHLFFLSGRRTF